MFAEKENPFSFTGEIDDAFLGIAVAIVCTDSENGRVTLDYFYECIRYDTKYILLTFLFSLSGDGSGAGTGGGLAGAEPLQLFGWGGS